MVRVNDPSYRPNGYDMSPALKRARRPFFPRNVITGVTLFGFAVSVWAYSMSAVKQEDFGDIDAMVPPPEDRAKMKSVEEEQKAQGELRSLSSALQTDPPIVPPDPTGVTSIATPTTTTSPSQPHPATSATSSRGLASKILPRLQLKMPVIDSTTSTLIWGAPSIDRLGALSDRSSSPGERRLV